MRKTLLFLLGAVLVIAAGVAALSAWEAHVVNVTAKIENALRISSPVDGKLSFGTVFPQEYLTKPLWITSSQSFCDSAQRRVLNIDYKIVQKPKPIWPKPIACTQPYQTVEEARTYCHQNPNDLNCCYPTLCPYLSKLPKYIDPKPYTDYGITAFHNPNDPSSVATGTINKDYDLADEWVIDLAVPCFKGMCAQEWGHPDWELDPALESKTFGCDLWVEVTDITLNVNQCQDGKDNDADGYIDFDGGDPVVPIHLIILNYNQ